MCSVHLTCTYTWLPINNHAFFKDANDNLMCKTEKEHRSMYRTEFWTLWEKASVGCLERTASKHIYYQGWNITSPGWMHETSPQTWCAGKTQRNWVEREVGGGSGWGIHVNPWLIHVNVWQNPLQYCKVISLQLIKINGKKNHAFFKITHVYLVPEKYKIHHSWY